MSGGYKYCGSEDIMFLVVSSKILHSLAPQLLFVSEGYGL